MSNLQSVQEKKIGALVTKNSDVCKRQRDSGTSPENRDVLGCQGNVITPDNRDVSRNVQHTLGTQAHQSSCFPFVIKPQRDIGNCC